MSRYIDADAFIRNLQERYCRPCKASGLDYGGVKCKACPLDDEMDDVDGFANNGIDIVFCKECKHYDTDVWTTRCWCGRVSSIGNCKYVKSDDFCSYGEREDE